jgi:hypothetical protein
MRKGWSPVCLLCITALPCAAQFMTSLQPETVQAFEAYVKHVEADLDQRWSGKQPFLSVDGNPSERAKVLAGDFWIHPGNPQTPISIHDGLIHDWVGAIFIPHVTMQKVLDVLQNFDRHQQVYTEVKRSKLLKRDGNDITGFWRLERKQSVVTVVLDVTQEVHWKEVAPGKWRCRAYTINISEVQRAGTPQEKILPPGQGRGFLWRLDAYWSLEATNGGVLAECRTLSLSRDIPAVLAWAIKPFLQTVPRDSLAGTLRHTRDAAEQ